MVKLYSVWKALTGSRTAFKNTFFRIPAMVLVLVMLLAVKGWGQALLVEDFDYPNGSLLTANGWTAHSGTTNFITVTNPGTISYPGYLSSGVGGEVTMLAGSGEDDNKTFTQQTSGTIYFSFLVNITSAGSGNYFFHTGAFVMGTTNFRGRVFAKKDASNNLFFGISNSTTTANYSTTAYALNTTYLLVLKYEIVTGASNDGCCPFFS
jgi:hypothetical protein